MLSGGLRAVRAFTQNRQAASFSLKFPKKLEGTFAERWADYWLAVLKDYKSVFVDLVEEAKNKPPKAIAWASAVASIFYLSSRNPDESDFRDAYLSVTNDFAFVGPSIRNPETVEHLKRVERYYNQGVVRRISLGIFSIVYVDPYRTEFSAPKATCQYLRPQLLSFPDRVVDVGFLGRWWILERKIVDWDVNPDEWEKPQS